MRRLLFFLMLPVLFFAAPPAQAAGGANSFIPWATGDGVTVFNDTSMGYMQFDYVNHAVSRLRISGVGGVVFDGMPRGGEIICLPPGRYVFRVWPGNYGLLEDCIIYRYTGSSPYRPSNYDRVYRYGYRYPGTGGYYSPNPYGSYPYGGGYYDGYDGRYRYPGADGRYGTFPSNPNPYYPGGSYPSPHYRNDYNYGPGPYNYRSRPYGTYMGPDKPVNREPQRYGPQVNGR